MKAAVITIFLFQIVILSARAQFTNNAIVNNNGATIDYPNWTNSLSGVYNGYNGGVFNHATLFTNHGVYNAEFGHRDVFQSEDLYSNKDIEITGSVRPFLFWADFKNGSSGKIVITNSDGVNIRGFADIQNGIFTTNRSLHQQGALRFEANASYQNANTDNQHVNGYVSKIGNEAFTFPVGNGLDIRALSMTAPSNVEAHISTAWIGGNPSTTIDPSDNAFHSTSATAGSFNVIPLGQWDWVSVVSPENELTIIVSLPSLTTYSKPDLRLVGWNGSRWTDLSGAATATGNTENSSLSGVIKPNVTISALAIGYLNGNPLPVTLLEFTAKYLENGNIGLNWSTAFEVNSNNFIIEYAVDGKNFIEVGNIAAANNSSSVKGYSFIHHPDISQSDYYYRIKMVDRDGTFAYSLIRSVKGDVFSKVKVFPNPTNNHLKIEANDWSDVTAVVLNDINGKKVYESKGRPDNEINVGKYADGLYILLIKYRNGTTMSQKVVID